MNKETLKHRIEYALEHIYKYDIEVEYVIWTYGEIAVRNYDIKGVHNLIHSIESRVI